MLKIKEAIVVEGRYDKNMLSQLVDTLIIETHGFGIFKDRERLAYLRKVAQKRGLLILTDSDSAGFLIRNHLKGAIPTNQIRHAYIPDIYGKEPRKRTASKEGKLGVEGIPAALLRDILCKAGATVLGETEKTTPQRITKTMLYEDGLSGNANAARLRELVLQELGLPQRMTANALLDALNTMCTQDDYKQAIIYAKSKLLTP